MVGPYWQYSNCHDMYTLVKFLDRLQHKIFMSIMKIDTAHLSPPFQYACHFMLNKDTLSVLISLILLSDLTHSKC